MILVADETESTLGLPSIYGVDDLPLIIQDKIFEDGRLVYPRHPMFLMHGMRGDMELWEVSGEMMAHPSTSTACTSRS